MNVSTSVDPNIDINKISNDDLSTNSSNPNTTSSYKKTDLDDNICFNELETLLNDFNSLIGKIENLLSLDDSKFYSYGNSKTKLEIK